jgi:hypothetical protein
MTTQTLIERLRLGTSISRERGLNLDFAEVAEQAAAALAGQDAEIAALKAQPSPVVQEVGGLVEDSKRLAILREAAWAVLSNEEHAFSGGMRNYQIGSPTWQVYQDLKTAAEVPSLTQQAQLPYPDFLSCPWCDSKDRSVRNKRMLDVKCAHDWHTDNQP